jgi:hypothetical protein
MKKSLNTISIEKPCHENWDAMSNVEKGKHCELCKKNVIDFSKMNDEEIIEIIQKNKNESMCGRFKSTQLNRPLNYQNFAPYKLPKFNRLFASLLVLSTATISIACSSDDKNIKTNTTMLKGEVKMSDNFLTETSKPIVNTFKGKLINNDTKSPIDIATITIANTNVTTISDENGAFNFVIPDSLMTDTLIFNIKSIGYENLTYTVQKNELNQDFVIRMKEIEMLIMGIMKIDINDMRKD